MAPDTPLQSIREAAMRTRFWDLYRSTGFDDEPAYAVSCTQPEHRGPLSRVWIYDRPPTKRDDCENALIWIDAECHTLRVYHNGVWKVWDGTGDNVHHPEYPTLVVTLKEDGTPAWCEETLVASQRVEAMERCGFDGYAVSRQIFPVQKLLKIHLKAIVTTWHQDRATNESLVSSSDESNKAPGALHPRRATQDYNHVEGGRGGPQTRFVITVNYHTEDSRSDDTDLEARLVAIEEFLGSYNSTADSQASRPRVLKRRREDDWTKRSAEVLAEALGLWILAAILRYVLWK